jgi:hypothetical protein
MYIVTEANKAETLVRGVFANRTVYERQIPTILDRAQLGSTIIVQTATLNSCLFKSRVVEKFKVEIVPEVRQAVRIK